MGDKRAATAAAATAGKGAPSTPTGTTLTCHEQILQLRPEVEPAVLPVEAEPLLFFLLLYLIQRPLDVIPLGVRLRTQDSLPKLVRQFLGAIYVIRLPQRRQHLGQR